MSPKYHRNLDTSVLGELNDTHAKVLRLVGTRKRVLEIGCATGYMTRQMIHGQECEVIALEIDVEAAQLAREAGASILMGDVESESILEQIDGQFDVVVMADVLEHLREPRTVLERLRTMLASEGRLIVSVPNVAHWTVRRALFLGHFDYGEKGILDSSHLRFFTRASIRYLLNESGYRVTRMDAMYIFPANRRLGLRHLANKWRMPSWLSGLFGYQFIIEAKVK